MSSVSDGRAAYWARHQHAAPRQDGGDEQGRRQPDGGEAPGGGLIPHLARGRMRHQVAHGRQDERAAVAEALRAHDELVAALRQQGSSAEAGGRP